MSWQFWMFLILGVIAVLLLLLGTFVKIRGRAAGESDVTSFGGRISIAGTLFAVIAIIALVLGSVTIVGTRQVGILTSFGKPTGELSNGFHVKPPWTVVHEMDAAIQLQSFEGDSYDEPGTAVKVRLGNNSAAYVESNLNWRIKQEAAPKMYQDYRTFDNIKSNLVDKQLQVALSKEFASFNPQEVKVLDPQAPPSPPAAPGSNSTPTPQQGAKLPEIAAQVKKDLQNAVGSEIEIMDVRIPGIFYDSATQQRIDQFNQKAQETKNAEQDVQTARQNKLASEQRAAQTAPDLRIAIFNCINTQVDKGKDPAGCWGQIAGGGNSNPLIQIPAPQPQG